MTPTALFSFNPPMPPLIRQARKLACHRLGGTKGECRRRHEIAAEMAISQFAMRAQRTALMRMTHGSPPKGKANNCGIS